MVSERTNNIKEALIEEVRERMNNISLHEKYISDEKAKIEEAQEVINDLEKLK